MQHRLSAVWDRLVESGIDSHIKRQNVEFYKAIRSDWFYRIHSKKITEELLRNEDISSTLMLIFVVSGLGYSMAIIVFAMELVWASCGCVVPTPA